MKQATCCFYCFKLPVYHDHSKSLCIDHFSKLKPNLVDVAKLLSSQQPEPHFKAILEGNPPECILHSYYIHDGSIEKVTRKNDDILEFKKKELKSNCSHLPQFKDCVPFRISDNHIACKECDLQSNLWICLACGWVACGRDQVGLKGNSHMLRHYSTSKHSVVVKLTSLSHSDYDAYCYLCDDALAIPNCLELIQKLFKSNNYPLASVNKTEDTLFELELQQNLSIQFNLQGIPFKKPHYIGFTNIGNSCYINASIQAINPFYLSNMKPVDVESLLRIDSISNRFIQQLQYQLDPYYLQSDAPSSVTINDQQHTVNTTNDTQQLGLNIINLKKQFSLKHSLFNNMHQQDAQEFLMFLIEDLELEYNLLKQTKCQLYESIKENNEFKSTQIVMNTISIPIVIRDSTSLMNQWQSQWTESINSFQKQTFFKTFPPVLIIQLVKTNEHGHKLDVTVDIPNHLNLDSLKYNGNKDLHLNAPFDFNELRYDQDALQQIMAMGIDKSMALAALQKTDKVDQAIQMIFDGQVQPSSQQQSNSFDSSHIDMITSMGFTIDQAKHAITMSVPFKFI